MKKLFIIICSVACVACSKSIEQTPTDLKNQALLVGTWLVTDVKEKESDEWVEYTDLNNENNDNVKITLRFYTDLAFYSKDRMHINEGSYKIIGNTIVCNIKKSSLGFNLANPVNPPPQFMSAYEPGAPNYRIVSISETEAIFDGGFYMKAKRE